MSLLQDLKWDFKMRWGQLAMIAAFYFLFYPYYDIFLLRSYGMEVQDFNALSDIVSKEKMLKKKVLLQSYLYK